MGDIEERRTDILNSLVVRVTVLEEKNADHVVSINHHDTIIDRLIQQDHELLTSLNAIASKLEIATVSIGTKSDNLISQFKIGFKVLYLCTGALIFSIGAFYTYSKDLDAKYMPKFESLVRNTAAQKNSVEDIKEDVETQGVTLKKVKTLAQHTAEKKSVRASK
ncbi:MAG: hypothetical protein WC756_21670 [Taibaiella sp.]|jgi:ornithine cyclodeaminase/alanine dehydrogenase-like protein (mu-crystallin family)